MRPIKTRRCESEHRHSEDPVAVANIGSKRVVTDCMSLTWMNFSGQPENRELIKDIVKEMQETVQVGGGIRTRAYKNLYLDGRFALVLGTKALENRDFLAEMASSFPIKSF